MESTRGSLRAASTADSKQIDSTEREIEGYENRVLKVRVHTSSRQDHLSGKCAAGSIITRSGFVL